MPALAHAAWCYEQRLVRGWPNADEGQRATAVDLAWRALASAENDAKCIALPGFVLFLLPRLILNAACGSTRQPRKPSCL